jgi:glyoxylase-like metal-dependent hydrolase (beta-lactamase superfamily II)
MLKKLSQVKIESKVSRRQLFKSAGFGAAAVALSQYVSSAHAQEADMPALPLALKRLSLGDASVTLIQEAALQLPPAAFGGGAPEGAVAALLAENNLPTDVIDASVNIIMFDNGTDKVLFDTGTGQTLLPALEAIGVPATDITAVVFSHFHGDHVGGASFEGQLAYPNAMYYFPEAEWDFIQGASDNQGAQNAVSKLQPAEDAGQLELFAGGTEVVTGVQAIFAPGHTPGHHIFDISSGDASLTFMADTANNYLAALSHPEWSFSFDSDPAQATATRREQYGRVADEQRRIVAYHFPFPGIGYIDRDGEGFNYFPA